MFSIIFITFFVIYLRPPIYNYSDIFNAFYLDKQPMHGCFNYHNLEQKKTDYRHYLRNETIS